ncbi:MAG TPA: neuraminidase-like domain-containing protein [Pyrinomonadaceae bacterium]
MSEKDEYAAEINGRVIDSVTREGVAGLRVEAWDKDLVFDDLVGSAVTDGEGAFRIEFGERHYRELVLDRQADLFFKLFRGGRLLSSTEGSVVWNAGGGVSDLVIEVDGGADAGADGDGAKAREVSGRVSLADGSPAAGVAVSVFDRDLRSEQPLGHAETDARGSYRVRYFAHQMRKREKGSADLVLRAAARDGSPLAASPVLFNAPPAAVLDLTIPPDALRPPSLFERIGRELAPLLDGLKPEELEENDGHTDLSFLAGETGFGREAVARFALAHRLARRGLAPEFWFALLGIPAFSYDAGLSLAAQFETILDALPSVSADAARKALLRAVRESEVPEAPPEKIAEWVEAFLRFAARRTVRESDNPTFVKQALEEAGVRGAREQEKFARLFNEHGALTPALLEAVEKDQSFSAEAVADLRASFRLAELTRGDFSVVKMLKDEFRIRRPEAVRGLAKRGRGELTELVRARHEAGAIKLPFEAADTGAPVELPAAEAYGRLLENELRDAFPTAAFAGDLERAAGGGGGVRGLKHAGTMRLFLAQHEEFELLKTPVDDFLSRGVRADFRAQAEDEGFRLEVKAVQRVFKLAPSFEATDELLADGIHSAQQVYRIGESEFVRRYSGRRGFTAESAGRAWGRAADTTAAVLTIVSDLKALDPEALPEVLKNGGEALKMFPNWENLFQSGDLCECEHCRSALGPAAYFADLLVFLRDRKAKPAAPGVASARDVLFKRRPDLGFIELNCENALTPLPYIDVVCEVLEAVVAGGAGDLTLAGLTTIADASPATKAAVADALEAALRAQGLPVQELGLGSDFSLSQIDPVSTDAYVAHGDDATYLLKRDGTPTFVARVLPNTKASAAELRAYPQYVNASAYDKLRAARHPSSLPFDLFGEEVRAALLKSNLKRWELMRAFRGPAAPNDPSPGDIAAEYFGIGVTPGPDADEKQLILEADPTDAGQRVLWGESGAGWLDAVGNVKSFLRKTRLTYDELLALLDLEFINPDGDVAVEHLDNSCDTDKKSVGGLDAAKLDRVHRFLRMWRKLKGWKLWELDLVVRHGSVGGGDLDETFLTNLFHFSELKRRLGPKTTVEQTLALFGDLNTRTRFTALHEKREGALYQNLFLNRRLVKPLDPAFELDPATGDLKPAIDPATGLPVIDPVTTLPQLNKISEHRPVLLAALGLREADLLTLEALSKASDGSGYVNDDLTLANISFLWRHAWLAKALKYKAEDWKTLLKIFDKDFPNFGGPREALNFLDEVEHLKAARFTPDDLNWLLAADRTAKAAVKEADAARFLAALRKELQSVRAEYDPARYDFLNAAPPTEVESLTALLTSLLQTLNRDEAATQFFISALRDELSQERAVPDLPAGFDFPASITGAPNNIPVRYEPSLHFAGTMTAAQRATLLGDPALTAVTGIPAYQDAVERLFQGAGPVTVEGLPAGFTFPATVTGAPNNIPVRYEPKLRFTGLMTAAQRATLLGDASLAAVTGLVSYQQAVEEFFTRPALALKFFEPVFTAPLAALPAGVDFKTLADPLLAQGISYDAELRLLRFAGVLSPEGRAALDALSADAGYRAAVASLFTQPSSPAPPPETIWLREADLLFPLRDPDTPAADNLARNLATAAKKALAYLSRTLSDTAVVQQASASLGLTPAVTRLLLTRFAPLPDTLLAHLTGPFAATNGVVDYATLKPTFDGWFWAGRVASLLLRWKLTLEELERLLALTAGAKLLDFLTLPLDDAGSVAPPDTFLRTSRLLRLRDALPETEVTLLEVLHKLDNGVYAAEAAANPPATERRLFAEDVERLDEDWRAADVEELTKSLDLAFPADYLLAESWERLRGALSFVESLNAGAATVETFAAAAMTQQHAATLKELLRSKFGAETWLTLSAEIQDALRERKRDALAAYLLSRPQPSDAPSGKWENANDLYAYYLLDVEMSACQLTSRLVQASGSVQLFVQRCFMGLEPEVEVRADGADADSAWRWWKWMRKYRVWEANRKVFLWPENWIEPELRKDKSQFFKDLEAELLQNEITQFSAETALQNYLEKLRGVEQLEVAGFYHEDDGDNAILHVFGRTTDAEPHTYYYRRYDYSQWTPWERVELDIEGDYLIPAVVNRRLFLFWPIFKEVPDDDLNSSAPIPDLVDGTTATVPPVWKRLHMRMAVSQYRQGKWAPKKVSKDAAVGDPAYSASFIPRRGDFTFIPVDRSAADGRFGIKCWGPLLGEWNFEVAGCDGAPALTEKSLGDFSHAIRPEIASTGGDTEFSKWLELLARGDDPENDFALENPFAGQPALSDALRTGIPILLQTPGLFRMTPPWHLSYMDKLLLDGLQIFEMFRLSKSGFPVPLGTWLPFFYNDQKRTFFVLPSLRPEGSERLYYPQLKLIYRHIDDFMRKVFAKSFTKKFDGVDLAQLTPAGKIELAQMEQFFTLQFPDAPRPPYTVAQLIDLLVRFFMRLVRLWLGQLSLFYFQFRQFHFKNFHHPFVCELAKTVHDPLKGIPALMSRETQLQNSGFSFLQSYRPTPWVVEPPEPDWVVEPPTEKFYPKEVIDFSPDGAYSPYNWELFFHAPLFIANSLSRNQRFEEARDWYHFIFNPLGVEGPAAGSSAMSKFWVTKPFFETTDPDYVRQRIENILAILASDTTAPGYSPDALKALEQQVLDWRDNPFEPHRLANYRTVAYQKTVVMKYLDNLVAWGDYLFRQDSMESINEATQLYILADELLGPRPAKVPPRVKPPVESFNELEKQFDDFANALVQVENVVPPLPGGGGGGDAPPLPTLYFCIPRNEKMLGYWDTVADRLYKIRHCMNIEGVVRQLALFEPPIDPAALVKAVAGGMDIGAALTDLNAPLPLYRFNVLLQKANEVCNDVKALGGALLAALEKQDAEELGQLRQELETNTLEAVLTVREHQIKEAKEQLEGLKRSKAVVETRRDYYRDIQKTNAGEELSLDLQKAAFEHQTTAQNINIGASALGYIPNVTIGGSGFGGSPHVNAQWGTGNIISALQAAAGAETQMSNALNFEASRALTQAGYERRFADWQLQERLAERELAQLDRQIAAAEIRLTVAEEERNNHKLQIENSKAVSDFMRSKYTNEELYQWQVGQISGVYFQAYRLAYDLAKRAERCFRFELGLPDSSFINFGYWDSLRKGLLSGEKLQYDLRRLEAAYLEQNRREFELTKHVSLAQLDPLALVKLRETGRCFFRLPEELFDLDYPGHYFRRVKSVSVTLPCVVGPYTTISCTLRLLKNSIRVNTSQGDNGYPRNTDDEGLPAEDTRFVENSIPVRAVAASHAQNDSGVFELGFRDERYLPFEGAGVVGEWSLELFNDPPANNPDPAAPDFGAPLRQFDYGTISDAVVHLKYTAREDAGPFKNKAVAHLRDYFGEDGASPALRLFSLRQEFPTQWHRFLNPAAPGGANVFEFEMSPSLFPLRDAGKTLKVNRLWLLARCTDDGVYEAVFSPPLPEPPAPGSEPLELGRAAEFGGLHFAARGGDTPLGVELVPTGPPVKWRLTMTNPAGDSLQKDALTQEMEVEDVLLVLGYEWD